MRINLTEEETILIIENNFRNFLGKKHYLFIYGYIHALQKFNIINKKKFEELNSELNLVYGDKEKKGEKCQYHYLEI